MGGKAEADGNLYEWMLSVREKKFITTAILGEDILALPSKHPDTYEFSLQANRDFLNELTVLRGQKASLAKTKSEEITFDMSCVARRASRLPTQDWKTGLRFPSSGAY